MIRGNQNAQTTQNQIMKSPKQIPYTISNFETIITENYYFVDKTKYIEELEKAKYPVFLRPRRFGKSLFTEILRWYYDIKSKDRFDELFGNLYIGKNPTKLRNSYYYIKFSFSGMSAWSKYEPDIIKKQFDSKIMVELKGFLRHYQAILSLDNEYMMFFADEYRNNATGALSEIINLVATQGEKLFIAIDEYDSLTNAMSIHYKDASEAENKYLDILSSGGFFRSFFETIKEGTTTSVDKVYITGILPITIADMNSGYNIAEWITFDRDYSDMLGFTQKEVETLVNKVYTDYKIDFDKKTVLDVLKLYYDGYKFTRTGEYLYNPMMTLYFIKHLIKTNELPDLMTDTNIRIDYNQIAYIFGNNTEARDETILKITEDKKIRFSSKLNINFDMKDYKEGNYIPEGLFYSGILTYGKYKNELKIPNLVTYEMALSYFTKITNYNASGYVISEIVDNYKYSGDVQNLIANFFREAIQKFPGDFFKNANESFYHGLLFYVLWNTFTKDVYEVLPEFNLPQGKADLILHSYPGANVRHELQDIFEIKQVPKGTSDVVFEHKFQEGILQLQKYRTGEYKDWRGIAVCFRGNKDYKIMILDI